MSTRNVLKLDPTRTVTLRRGFTRGTAASFKRLRSALLQLVVGEDAFGLSSQRVPAPVGVGNDASGHPPTSKSRTGEVHGDAPELVGPTTNVFCPTGKGGGIDPHCKKGGAHAAGGGYHEVAKELVSLHVRDSSLLHDEDKRLLGSIARDTPTSADKLLRVSGRDPGHREGETVDWTQEPKSFTRSVDTVLQGGSAGKIGYKTTDRAMYLIEKPTHGIDVDYKAIDHPGFDVGREHETIVAGRYTVTEVRKVTEPGTFAAYGYKATVYILREVPTTNTLSTNKRWAYETNDQAAEQFEKWLRSQVSKELLSEAEAKRWRRYVARGFERGANRALNDVKRGRGKGAKAARFLDPTRGAGFEEGAREAFLRTTLSRPSAAEKLRLLQSQSLSEVRGLADDLVAKGRRVLVDSLVRNLSPREVAERLSKTLKISEARARTIANTELVRAHAEGQLEAMEQLGVETVGVAVEWSSMAGACPLCSPLNHIVLKLSEARGMLPRHPNCRCAWKVANVVEGKEERKLQKRSKTKIDKAVKKSQREGGDADEWGPNREVSRERPQQLVNYSEAELSFSSMMKRLGLV